jgi:hypothetical protein
VTACAIDSLIDLTGALRDVRPKAIVADLFGEDSACEIVSVAEREKLRAAYVFLVPDDARQVRRRTPFSTCIRSGNLRPVRLAVRRALETVDASRWGLADYLQLAATASESLIIEVSATVGWGVILVRRGECWVARDRLGGGPMAFQRIAALPSPRFVVTNAATAVERFGARELFWKPVAAAAVAARAASNTRRRQEFSNLIYDLARARG